MNLNLHNYIVLLLASFIFLGCSGNDENSNSEITNGGLLSDKWHGQAIAYSGYREGQTPKDKIFPSQAEVLEDLKIIEKEWKIIRTYGADQHAYDVLAVIRKEKINLKVMLGIWLDGEPEYIDDNKEQIKYGIELANEYKDIVIAINVGNESQIHWSDHKVPTEKLVSYINEVKTNTNVPVTTADTWDYWLDLELSSKVIEAVDFLAVHIYPIWGNVDIDRGMTVTTDTYKRLVNTIPDKKIIITEAGWATYTVGELHVPKAGDEIKQEKYYIDLMKWSKDNNVIVFWFEAFDEPWKGEGTEGYWGLFNVDRKAKLAMHKYFPELLTEQPTSPSYD